MPKVVITGDAGRRFTGGRAELEVAAPPDGDSCRRCFTPVLAVDDYGGFWRAVVVKGENRHGTLFLDTRAAQKPRKSIG